MPCRGSWPTQGKQSAAYMPCSPQAPGSRHLHPPPSQRQPSGRARGARQHHPWGAGDKGRWLEGTGIRTSCPVPCCPVHPLGQHRLPQPPAPQEAARPAGGPSPGCSEGTGERGRARQKCRHHLCPSLSFSSASSSLHARGRTRRWPPHPLQRGSRRGWDCPCQPRTSEGSADPSLALPSHPRPGHQAPLGAFWRPVEGYSAPPSPPPAPRSPRHRASQPPPAPPRGPAPSLGPPGCPLPGWGTGAFHPHPPSRPGQPHGQPVRRHPSLWAAAGRGDQGAQGSHPSYRAPQPPQAPWPQPWLAVSPQPRERCHAPDTSRFQGAEGARGQARARVPLWERPSHPPRLHPPPSPGGWPSHRPRSRQHRAPRARSRRSEGRSRERGRTSRSRETTTSCLHCFPCPRSPSRHPPCAAGRAQGPPAPHHKHLVWGSQRERRAEGTAAVVSPVRARRESRQQARRRRESGQDLISFYFLFYFYLFYPFCLSCPCPLCLSSSSLSSPPPHSPPLLPPHPHQQHHSHHTPDSLSS